MKTLNILIKQVKGIYEDLKYEYPNNPLKDIVKYMEKWLELHDKVYDHSFYNKILQNYTDKFWEEKLHQEIKELHILNDEVIKKYGL